LALDLERPEKDAAMLAGFNEALSAVYDKSVGMLEFRQLLSDRSTDVGFVLAKGRCR